MLKPGDTIEYLDDVSSPPNQKGSRGQTKVIDRDIPMWTAKFLLRGGKIRPYDPASPLQLEDEENKERRIETNGRRKTVSETDQKGDHGPERPDPKRKSSSRRR